MDETPEVFDPVKFFEDMKDSPNMNNIRTWIESYSPLECIASLNFSIDTLEVLVNAKGEKLPREGEYLQCILPSPLTNVAVTLKDGSVHKAGYLQTGEVFKVKA